MKKFLLFSAMLLTAGLTTGWAMDDPDPDEQVLNLFKKEFSAAQQVSWSRQGDYDKATFILAGYRVVAWFNPQTTQLEGSVREIFFDQLPLGVMTAVDKRFPEADISNVKEINNSEGTSYRILLASKNKSYTIKISAGGSISEIEKMAK